MIQSLEGAIWEKTEWICEIAELQLDHLYRLEVALLPIDQIDYDN